MVMPAVNIEKFKQWRTNRRINRNQCNRKNSLGANPNKIRT